MTQVIAKTGFAADDWAGVPTPELDAYEGGRALQLRPDDDPDAVAPLLEGLDLIVIPFATNADGRGLSLAAELRTLGFTGHLRARGHLLVDQFRAAIRCGFDDVEISAAQAERNPEEQWLAVPFATAYQSHLFAKSPQ